MVYGLRRNSRRRRPGFTLVEILIVVVILGILAAIVVPQFSNASAVTRENVLREDLRFLRNAILTYHVQHNSVAPGFPGGDTSQAPTESDFVAQLTSPTNASGAVGGASSALFPFGPYLREMPDNPVNQLNTVRIVGPGAFPANPAGTHGWVYQPSTKKFAADCEGTGLSGTRYFDY